MRTALALATALAGSVFGVVGLAAPAGAVTTCAPPHMEHFVVDSIEVEHVDCDTARHVARAAIHSAQGHEWSCHASYHGTLQHLACTRVQHPHQKIKFFYKAYF